MGVAHCSSCLAWRPVTELKEQTDFQKVDQKAIRISLYKYMQCPWKKNASLIRERNWNLFNKVQCRREKMFLSYTGGPFSNKKHGQKYDNFIKRMRKTKKYDRPRHICWLQKSCRFSGGISQRQSDETRKYICRIRDKLRKTEYTLKENALSSCNSCTIRQQIFTLRVAYMQYISTSAIYKETLGNVKATNEPHEEL